MSYRLFTSYLFRSRPPIFSASETKNDKHLVKNSDREMLLPTARLVKYFLRVQKSLFSMLIAFSTLVCTKITIRQFSLHFPY